MWRLFQKKKIHEAFKQASLDSTRGLSQRVLGQKSIRALLLQEFCGQERATDNKFQNKVRVRTLTKISSFKFKVTLHEGLSINSSKNPLLLLSRFSHVRLCATHRWQPTRLPHPWDSPGKNTGVGSHFLLQCMKVKSESEVAQLCPTLANPWTAAHQAPPSMGFSRQKYWSGVPLPSPKNPLSNVK